MHQLTQNPICPFKWENPINGDASNIGQNSFTSLVTVTFKRFQRARVMPGIRHAASTLLHSYNEF